MWFALAACGSVLLLAITNQVGHEVAVIPMLWALPLAIYLLSFVLCFGRETHYPRAIYRGALLVALALVTMLLPGSTGAAPLRLLVYGTALFVACMVCHGELARLKPHARYVTRFYLVVTAGGAAGGMFVGLVAPRVFNGFWELHIGLVGVALLVLFIRSGEPAARLARVPDLWNLAFIAVAALLLAMVISGQQFDLLRKASPAMLLAVLVGIGVAWRYRGTIDHTADARQGRGMAWWSIGIAGLIAFASVHWLIATRPLADTIMASRNFYGVLSVATENIDQPGLAANILQHGQVVHGLQFRAEPMRHEPTSYYLPETGIGRIMRFHPARRAGRGFNVGVVGLGAGTLAVYGRRGDHFHFYEIDPDVIALAGGKGGLFSYLADSVADITTVAGDARLSLERELATTGSRQFDILVLDAFTSGSIPVHLLTREAFEIYRAHLRDAASVIAVHISNAHLDLEPVLSQLARHYGLQLRLVTVQRRFGNDTASTWALLTADPAIFDLPQLRAAQPPSSTRSAPLWTDSYSNVIRLLKLEDETALQAPPCVDDNCPEWQEFMGGSR
jgi:hypothetical protein